MQITRQKYTTKKFKTMQMKYLTKFQNNPYSQIIVQICTAIFLEK